LSVALVQRSIWSRSNKGRSGLRAGGGCSVREVLRRSMTLVDVRKLATVVEEVFHEGGPKPLRPLRQGAVLAVIANPYAGRYVEDILPLMEALKPLGLEMAWRLVGALGVPPRAGGGYGKGSIIGAGGGLEHGGLWHDPGWGGRSWSVGAT